MPQAPTYTRQTGFASDERTNTGGRATVRTDRLDAELDALGVTANTNRDNLELIQRDDGRLRDGIVRPESLSTTTAAMFGGSDFLPRGLWVTGTLYAFKDLVEVDAVVYVGLSTHTAGADFATDLAAGLWMLFPGQADAASVIFTPTDDIAETDVQAAIEAVSTAARNSSLAILAYLYGAF